MDKNNNKKIAFVTGGSRGIGKAIVEKLGKENYLVGFNYVNSEKKANTFINELKANGIEAFCKKFDVSDYNQTAEAIEQIQEEYGNIDILVNNAGITKDKLFSRMKEADFDNVINTNLKGVFNCTKQVTNKMMRQKFGRIINLSSIAGIIGNIGQASYSASKAGVIGFTRTLAAELGGHGITVNAIAPGFIKTDMTDVLSETVKENILNLIPLKDIGQPDDIANMVAYLAGDSGRYITGQVISIDGGLSAI
ncbi:MAG: 3-oxoacyl-[acyl-carrier-protein] reductase [Eubacteriales bacterium]|nr:3-oxoacyl-[acyl-carrier-protein] reductase [Eubacteriales bacterium]MDY3332421.1 3-oxoacyl-[acyl-carrier-protein] reductase [Gallibacter sp.]